tara:strand:+ start:383 stop:520 length:138 start_codon:yes stop_codon:yes gene_type:complete
MSFLHQWDYKYLCELEQRKTMEEETYWNTTSTYGDDYEIIYHITE